LSKVAQSLKLGEKLRLSHGEETSGGRENQTLLANTFEAVIGAIYLNKGKRQVVSFVKKHLLPELDTILKNHLQKDAKSKLQELIQAQSLPAPTYKVEKEEGPDHDKTFTISVLIDGKQIATGIGKSKQTAQQHAASAALEKCKLK
jgi:ribonuclease-3